MPLFNWEESLSVSIKEYDDHHKKLINLINELHDAMRVGKSKEVMNSILKTLTDYTVFHFSAEEKQMTKYSFPEYTAHKAEHDKFIKKVADFKHDLDAGKAMFSMEVMSFLKEWIANHVTKSDKKYGPFLNEKGIK